MFSTNNLKKRVEELEDKVWQLENPPKFKRGDIVDISYAPLRLGDASDKNLIVCGVEIQTRYYFNLRPYKAWCARLVTQDGYEMSLDQDVLVLSKTTRKK